MVSRALAFWLLVVQVLPTLCCLTMAPKTPAFISTGECPPPTTSCCAAPAPSECDATDQGSTDQSGCTVAAPHCCPLCATTCCEDRPAPLERRDQRHEQGRPLGPEVLFAEASYPAPTLREPGTPARCWTERHPASINPDRLRATLGVWLI